MIDPTTKLIDLNLLALFKQNCDTTYGSKVTVDDHELRLIDIETLGANQLDDFLHLFMSEKNFNTLTGGENHTDATHLSSTAIYYTWSEEESSEPTNPDPSTVIDTTAQIVGILGTVSGNELNLTGSISGGDITLKGTVREP